LKNKKKREHICTFSRRKRKEGRKKINDHQQQITHHLSLCATLGKRGSGGASKDMVEGQVWSPDGVTRANIFFDIKI